MPVLFFRFTSVYPVVQASFNFYLKATIYRVQVDSYLYHTSHEDVVRTTIYSIPLFIGNVFLVTDYWFIRLIPDDISQANR